LRFFVSCVRSPRPVPPLLTHTPVVLFASGVHKYTSTLVPTGPLSFHWIRRLQDKLCGACRLLRHPVCFRPPPCPPTGYIRVPLSLLRQIFGVSSPGIHPLSGSSRFSFFCATRFLSFPATTLYPFGEHFSLVVRQCCPKSYRHFFPASVSVCPTSSPRHLLTFSQTFLLPLCFHSS